MGRGREGLILSMSDVLVICISSFFGQPQKFLKASCLDHLGKFSRYQSRDLSEILRNTENTKEKKKEEKRKGKRIKTMKDNKMLE